MGQNNYRLLSHALPTAIQVHSTPFFNLLLLYLKSVSATLKCSSTTKYIALQLDSQCAWDFYLWRLIIINRVSPWYDIRGWVGVKFQLRSYAIISTANVASVEGVCITIIISADGHISSWSVLTEILSRQLWMPTAIWLIIGADRDISSVSLSVSVPTAITAQYHCQYQCWQLFQLGITVSVNINADSDNSLVSLSILMLTAITAQHHCQYKCWQHYQLSTGRDKKQTSSIINTAQSGVTWRGVIQPC